MYLPGSHFYTETIALLVLSFIDFRNLERMSSPPSRLLCVSRVMNLWSRIDDILCHEFDESYIPHL